MFLVALLEAKLYHEFDEFIEIAYNSRKWEKWAINSELKNNHKQCAIISGHYVMENERVKEIKQELNKKIDLDYALENHLKNVIMKYVKAFGW